MVFHLLTIYVVELKTKCNISEVYIERKAMNPYSFGLDEVVNEGAGKTRPALYQKSYITHFKTLQDLLRLSVRDRFPVLLTVVVISFHGLKGENEIHNTKGE